MNMNWGEEVHSHNANVKTVMGVWNDSGACPAGIVHIFIMKPPKMTHWEQIFIGLCKTGLSPCPQNRLWLLGVPIPNGMKQLVQAF